MSQPSRARPLIRPGRLLLLRGLATWGLCLAAAAPAAAGPVVGGAEATAMGGTTRVSLRSTGSVLTAPAVLALRPRYELQVTGEAGPDSLLGVRAYALDSSTGPLALGLGYQYAHTVPDTRVEDLPGWLLPDDDLQNESARTVVGGGLSTSFGDRRVALGLGFSWLNQATRYTDNENWFEGSVSVAGRIGSEEELVLSAVADNLLTPGHEDTPLTFAGGATFRPAPPIALASQLDVLTGTFEGPAEVGFGVGLEGLIAETVALRGGFHRDPDRDSDLATAGVGAFTDAMSVDYAAELVVGHAGRVPAGWDDGKLRHQHSLSLMLKF